VSTRANASGTNVFFVCDVVLKKSSGAVTKYNMFSRKTSFGVLIDLMRGNTYRHSRKIHLLTGYQKKIMGYLYQGFSVRTIS